MDRGNTLWDVEIVDRKPGQVKLHYVGWAETYLTPIVKRMVRAPTEGKTDEQYDQLLYDLTHCSPLYIDNCSNV